MSVSVRSFPSVGWVRRPREDEPGGRLSGDPLGLCVFVQHLAGRISPGLGRAQANVWGFGLLCAGFPLVSEGVRIEERFVRWQRLVLFAALRASWDQPTWGIGGIRNARRLEPAWDSIPLDMPLKSDEWAGGLWGAYARVARMYGLLSSTGTVRLRDHQLTNNGHQLATSTLNVLGLDPNDVRTMLRSRDPVDLEELGLQVGLATPAYLDQLSLVLEDGDRIWGRRLGWLWTHLPELPGPDPTELPDDRPYDEDQDRAVTAAREVFDLIRIVEGAFRSGDASELTGDLIEHPAFSTADSAGYGAEYGPIRLALVQGGEASIDELWRVHRDRHRAGGMWERGSDLPAYDVHTRPDFGLDAACAMYQQGLRL